MSGDEIDLKVQISPSSSSESSDPELCEDVEMNEDGRISGSYISSL